MIVNMQPLVFVSYARYVCDQGMKRQSGETVRIVGFCTWREGLRLRLRERLRLLLRRLLPLRSCTSQKSFHCISNAPASSKLLT